MALSSVKAILDSPESYDDDNTSCDKLLESMQSLRPLLNCANNDFFQPFNQLMSGSGSPFSTPVSAPADRSPTAMSADDLEMLDSPTMLSAYEQEMVLSGLATSSSTLSLSCDEPSPDNMEQWNLPVDVGSDDPVWQLTHDLSGSEVQLPEDTVEAKTNCQITKPEAPALERFERKWVQEVGNNSERRLHSDVQHHQSGSETKCRQSAINYSSCGKGFSRASSSIELFKQLDSSDNNSDGMADVHKNGRKKINAKAPTSKNLASERRRRKKLNERLYTLRAIVPKISKMDKASIVGDAITYVRDLQKQVQEMREDIADLETISKDAVPGELTDPSNGPKRVNAILAAANMKVMQPEHRIVELEVTQMEKHTFHLRVHCKKSPGVLVQLTRALEALDLEIVNANLTSVNDHILNTIVVEVMNGQAMKTEDLRKMTLEVIPRFGLFL